MNLTASNGLPVSLPPIFQVSWWNYDCRVAVPKVTVWRVGMKKEKRRKPVIGLAVNTLILPREGPSESLVKAGGKDWSVTRKHLSMKT